MQSFTAGIANRVTVDMKAKSNAEPITAGTVSITLQAKSGANEGKWFRASDSSWQISEAVAVAEAEHQSRGRWAGVIPAAAWITGVRYDVSGYESGNLHLDYSDEVVEIVTPKEVSFEATLTD